MLWTDRWRARSFSPSIFGSVGLGCHDRPNHLPLQDPAKLGEGGMGALCKAEDLKIKRPELSGNDKLIHKYPHQKLDDA